MSESVDATGFQNRQVSESVECVAAPPTGLAKRSLSSLPASLKDLRKLMRVKNPGRDSYSSHPLTMEQILKRDGHIEALLQRLVLRDSSHIRRLFNCGLVMCLVYTGTALPYRLAFIEFAIPKSLLKDDGWTVVETIIDVFFWLDFVACFFFSYRDVRGREVLDVRAIAWRYLRTFFAINLVACLPPQLVGVIVQLFDPTSSSEDQSKTDSVHKTVRIARLQRMSRLARLIRMARVTKLVSFFLESSIMTYIRSFRGIRIMNFISCLLWVVHITACIWYICAALHKDPQHTWVSIHGGDGVPLLEKGPAEQWLYALYFVLTVFTTVGFGDISASTVGEMALAMIIMLLGVVVNGIILSEVIQLITCVDQEAREIVEQKELIEGFAEHVDLHPKSKRKLQDWVGTFRSRVHGYNRDKMRDIIVGVGLPRDLTGTLPQAMFNGRLVHNRLITLSSIPGRFCIPIPHRFPLLVALAINPRHFEPGETVYHSWDHAWNIFIVISGVFAAVARQLPQGGLIQDCPVHGSFAATTADGDMRSPTDSGLHDKPCPDIVDGARPPRLVPFRLFCAGNYFGDIELLLPGHRPRRFSVRCEEHSSLLILHKEDMTRLAHEFPQAWRVWRCIALSREVQRLREIQLFVSPGGGHRELAAFLIQRYWRRPPKSARSTREMGPTRKVRVSLTCSDYSVPFDSALSNGDDLRPSHRTNLPAPMAEELQAVRDDVAQVKGDVAAINKKLDAILWALKCKTEGDIESSTSL